MFERVDNHNVVDYIKETMNVYTTQSLEQMLRGKSGGRILANLGENWCKVNFQLSV